VNKVFLWTTSEDKNQQALLDTSLLLANRAYPHVPKIVITNDLSFKNKFVNKYIYPDSWPINRKAELNVFDLLPYCNYDLIWSLSNRSMIMFNFDKFLKTNCFECIIRPNVHRARSEKKIKECSSSFIVSNAFFQINKEEIKSLYEHKQKNKSKSAYEELTNWSLTRKNKVYHTDLFFPTGFREMFELKGLLKETDIDKMPILELSENDHLDWFRSKYV